MIIFHKVEKLCLWTHISANIGLIMHKPRVVILLLVTSPKGMVKVTAVMLVCDIFFDKQKISLSLKFHENIPYVQRGLAHTQMFCKHCILPKSSIESKVQPKYSQRNLRYYQCIV